MRGLMHEQEKGGFSQGHQVQGVSSKLPIKFLE